MPLEPTDKFNITCECGAELECTSESAGRSMTCPECGVPLIVRPPSAELDDEELIEPVEPNQPEIPVASARRPLGPALGTRCTNCGVALERSGIHCRYCGFDPQTGRITPLNAKERTLARGAGRFLLGCLLSGIGALLAAGIWFAVAMSTGKTFGIIAIVVGVFAGYGMLFGYGGRNIRAGITASLISVIGIFVAQLLVFGFAFYAIVTGNTDDPENKRRHVQFKLAQEKMMKKGVAIAAGNQKEWEECLQEADRETSALTDAQIEERWQESKIAAELSEGWSTEQGGKRSRLAYHRGGRVADHEGLSYSDPRRQQLVLKEFAQIRLLSDSELDAAIVDLEQWETEGKWSNSEYVRDQLTRQFVDRAISEKQRARSADDDYWYPKDDEWNEMFRAARDDVSRLNEADRLAELKAIEERETRDELCYDLVEHRTEVRARLLGLYYTDPKRDENFKEEEEKCRALTVEEIEAAEGEIEEWDETVRFSKPEYVRSELIHALIDEPSVEAEHVDEESEKNHEKSAEQFEKEWKEKYRAAVARVDEIAPERHLSMLKELEEKAQQQNEQRVEKWQAEFGTRKRQQDQEAMSNFISAFSMVMYQGPSVYFILFATIVAFGIAHGKQT